MGQEGLSVFVLVCTGVMFYSLVVIFMLLFKKSSHRNSNRLLAAALAIVSWYTLTCLLFFSDRYLDFYGVFRIGVPLYYAIPVLIFFYVRSFNEENFKIGGLKLIHFLPVLLSAIDLIPYYTLDNETKKELIELAAKDMKIIPALRTGFLPDYINIWMRPIHGMFYMLLSIIYLYKTNVFNKHPKSIRIWQYSVAGFFLLIYTCMLIVNFIWNYLPYPSDYLLNFSLGPFFIGLAAIIFLHIFLFFNGYIISGVETEVGSVQTAKIENHLHVKRSVKHVPFSLHEIESYITENKLFKDAKLTAPDVAVKLGLSPHAFSNLLNVEHDIRFTDLINGIRIKYAISELQNGKNENMSIEGIAVESGFASRSAFYTSFKKITGQTPSQFLQKETFGDETEKTQHTD